MELRHLRYFIALAEELHFGRAAERVGIAQPPFGQQIRQLEQELGVELVSRTSRRVALTEAGKVMAAEARQTLEQAERAVRAAQHAGRGEVGPLCLGFASSAIHELLPKVIRGLHRQHPGLSISVLEMATEDQVRALRDCRIDVGFNRPPVPAKDLNIVTVSRHPLVVAMPEEHRLVTEQEIRLSQLADENFVHFSRQSGPLYYDRFISLCQKAGFSPKVTQEGRSTLTLINLVAAGLGVTLVSFSSLQNLHRKGVVYRPLVPPAPTVEMAMMWKKEEPSPALALFLKVMEELRPQLSEPEEGVLMSLSPAERSRLKRGTTLRQAARLKRRKQSRR